jgi:5'-nucleotidase
MPHILISNDDGIDSPTLVPLSRALAALGSTRVVVPDVERSWIGKAITRYGTLRAKPCERDGVPATAVSGTPADCVSLAVHTFEPTKPDIVVSGINMGLNYGISFVLSSGTIGAATEAWIAGIPAVAFSIALPGDAYGVAPDAEHADLAGRAERAAAVARDITTELLAAGLPEGVDVLSVNMPANVTVDTPRRVTKIARTRYGRLFVGRGDGFAHEFHRLEVLDRSDDGDVAVVDRGAVSITPIHFDLSTTTPDSFRRRFERG